MKYSDSTIWAWGLSNSGQLDLGDNANRSSLVQVPSLNLNPEGTIRCEKTMTTRC
ncbi:MAG: RCC1 domain-containing protein [Coprothermobacterota bacterium]|nr:RCC1 domain-containing protein [Coprothermobacterota bacterium]